MKLALCVLVAAAFVGAVVIMVTDVGTWIIGLGTLVVIVVALLLLGRFILQALNAVHQEEWSD